jgi:S-adenosylmethionine-diacylglycerol 3-amino-3-carboxypropyl transferase
MMDGYRRRPLYSADNEDARSELTALEITGEDSVVAIAAGGGRALSLLAAGPRRLVAVDRRPDQVFALELKAAAMDAFDHEEYLAFLGIGGGDGRSEQYRAMRLALSRSARRYWDHRPRLLAAGVFYAGRVESTLLRCMRRLRRLGIMDWAGPLFEAPDLETQREQLASHPGVRRGLAWWRLACHPLVIYPLAQDPGFLRCTEDSVGSYLARRLVRYASVHLVCESHLLRLLWDGELGPAGPLPPYLTRVGFERAKKHLERLEIQCADLRDLAARWRGGERIKWSLSDVSCWMAERHFHDLLRRLVGCGAPGSRLCARHFAARWGIPGDLRDRVRRLAELSGRLDRDDSSVFYRFDVAAYARDRSELRELDGLPPELPPSSASSARA